MGLGGRDEREMSSALWVGNDNCRYWRTNCGIDCRVDPQGGVSTHSWRQRRREGKKW